MAESVEHARRMGKAGIGRGNSPGPGIHRVWYCIRVVELEHRSDRGGVGITSALLAMFVRSQVTPLHPLRAAPKRTAARSTNRIPADPRSGRRTDPRTGHNADPRTGHRAHPRTGTRPDSRPDGDGNSTEPAFSWPPGRISARCPADSGSDREKMSRRASGSCGNLLRVIELRVLSPDDWRVWRELRLAALAEAPEAFGSRLADWRGDGDREERWRDRLTIPGSCNFVALLDGGDRQAWPAGSRQTARTAATAQRS